MSGVTEAKEAGRGTDTRPAPRSSTSALLHPTQQNPKLVLGRHGLRSISPATSSARFAAKCLSAVCSRCRKPKVRQEGRPGAHWVTGLGAGRRILSLSSLSEAWPERGAAWVLAALEAQQITFFVERRRKRAASAAEDVVGSVASHSARKAATASRGNTFQQSLALHFASLRALPHEAAAAGRPSTAGSRPGTAREPRTGLRLLFLP